MQEQVCKNCGNQFIGKYCNDCGEKVYIENDKSFRSLSEEVFHFITHLDNKYLKTLKALFTKPGLISDTFCNGVRKKFYKPVSLFLVGIIIYLIIPLSPGLNMSLQSNITNMKAIGIHFPEKIISQKIMAENVTAEVFSEKYRKQSVIIAKPMLFVILPLIGLALMLFFYPRKNYYFDHFILGVEISNFFLYFAFILLPLFLKAMAKFAWLVFDRDLYYNDYISGPIIVAALLLNWVIAFKRFYKVKTLHAIVKAALFLIPFLLIVFFIYRILLLLITLLFI